MATDKDKHISVTHFINPQLFWFHEISVPNAAYLEIKELEEQLERYYKSHQPWTQAIRKPATGMLVAVKFLSWHKMIRARVEHIANFSKTTQGGEFIMWAIDYGFPFQTKSEQIFRLPEKLSIPVEHVRSGGLADILPAERDFDFRMNCAVTNSKENWSQRACDLVDKLLNDAESVVFVEKFENENHAWGDLIITTHLGDKCNVRDYLVGMSLAVDAGPNFMEICPNLKVTKILPWMTNSGNSKFSANKGFLCPNNVSVEKKNAQKLICPELNEYAKKKVEDWCARNELADCQEPADFDADMLLDTIAFDDSVSNKNFETCKSKHVDAGHKPNKGMNTTNSHKQGNIEFNKNHGSNDNILSDLESVSSLNVDGMHEQKLALAGALSKSRASKYDDKELPPEPSELHFDISADSEKSLLKENAVPKENEKLLSGVESLASVITGVSSRKQKLLDKRKQLNMNQNVEQNINKKSQPVITQEPKHSKKYDNLIELTSNASSNLESDIEKQMRKTTLKDTESSSVTASCTNASVANSRVKRHLLNRQKLQNKKQPDNNSDSTSTNELSAPQASVPSKRMELLKKQRLEKLAQHEEPSSTEDSFKESDKQIHTKHHGAKPAVQPTKPSAHVSHLLNLRKKYNKDIKQHEAANNILFMNQEVKHIKDESRFELTTSNTRLRPAAEKLSESSTFLGLRMIPAGFDIANLHHYKNENNHWHRKATTRFDYVPHDEKDMESLDEAITNDKYKNCEKYKEKIAAVSTTGKSKHTNILDTTVPQINENPIDFGFTIDQESKSKVATLPEESSPSSSSNMSSPLPAAKKYGRRRSLKSPTSQMKKIDEILRSAYDEKADGNVDILDLKNLNSSGCKEDTDNTELYSAEDGTYGTASDKEDVDSERNSSNKRSLIRSRLQKKLAAQKAHLKQMEDQLTHELNSPQPESFRIHLPQMSELRSIEGEHKLKTKFIDHLVLAHSKVPLTALTSISDAFFLKEIHDEMENMRVTKLYRIQAYAWPHLLRGNSLFVVNPHKSGKTWSYLPAICSLVAYRLQSCRLVDTYGPVAIILMPTSAHVEVVHNYCKRLLLSVRPAVSTVASYGVRNANEAKIQLLNSCGILVATPGSLLRLLRDNENESLFDMERLKHLVIDDLDLMLSRSQDDIETVLKTFFKLAKRKEAGITQTTIGLQLVVTSCDWDSLLVALMRKANQPLLLIGDFIEAAVYGRVSISIKLCPSKRKISTILEFIEQNSLENERILVLCNSDDDVYEVVDALTTSAFVCIAYDSHSSADVRIIIEEWRKKKVMSSRILVCADSSFPELQIQNVSHVIHYSMPTSWTKFTARFSALAQTYENYVSNNFEMPTGVDRPIARSLILLDEENSIQLPRLMDFMKKHDQLKFIHSDILTVSKRVLVEREETRILQGTRMCPYVLEFGECDEPRCEFRHNLTRFDAVAKKDNIPDAGDIRILVLKVFSPTHYAARLLQYRSVNSTKWQDIRRSKEVCNFSMQMNMHYLKQENWNLHWPLHVGDLCVYKYADTYQRVRILELPDVLNTDLIKTIKLTVKLIDEGSIISNVKSDELYVCHDKFKDFPAQAINIRLSGVVPFDNERTWNTKATKAVQKWIMTDIKKNECVHVSINFTLIDTIWVNNVIVMEQLEQVGQYVYRVNLKRSLLEKDIAAAGDSKRPGIREIAEELGLLTADTTLSDSEGEFKSCTENDSSNLIKFSSNDETMESELLGKVVGAAQIEEDEEENVQGAEGMAELVNKAVDVEEDWDAQMNDNDNNTNEIYLPLHATSNETVANPLTTTTSTAQNQQSNNSNLISSTQTTEPDIPATVENAQKESPPTAITISQIEELSTPTLPLEKEEWLVLPLEKIVKVEIGSESENGNWDDIYLQNIDAENLVKFDELLDLINAHIVELKRKPAMPFAATWFRPMQNCIVHHDDRYLRAKLYGIFGSDPKATTTATTATVYRFFLCDYACFVMAKAEELYNDFLYPTTKEIVEFTPYQALHCRLAGIKLIPFAHKCRVTKDFLYAYAVKALECAPTGIAEFHINSYDILLFENELEDDLQTLELLNKTLIKHGVALADEQTKHFLHTKLKLPEVPKDLCSFDELLHCIQRSFELELAETHNAGEPTPLQAIEPPHLASEINSQGKTQNVVKTNPYKPLKAKGPNTSSDSDEEPLLSSTKTSSNSDNDRSFSSPSTSAQDTTTTSESALPPVPALQANYKRPQVSWYDTDCFIYLVIHAPDIRDYYLEVTKNTLIFHTVLQETPFALVLNLVGMIEPSMVSHEIRGLNVLVRLIKGVFMKWPRLLEQTTRYPWLTYNLNALDLTEVNKLLPQQQLEMILQKTEAANHSSSSDEESDDERNLFQTFTPLINSEDIHDPTVEIL